MMEEPLQLMDCQNQVRFQLHFMNLVTDLKMWSRESMKQKMFSTKEECVDTAYMKLKECEESNFSKELDNVYKK